MECKICHNTISEHDHYFELAGTATNIPQTVITLCEECATVTTVTDLYMAGLIQMNNSEDNTIESDAIVGDAVDVVYNELHSASNPT